MFLGILLRTGTLEDHLCFVKYFTDYRYNLYYSVTHGCFSGPLSSKVQSPSSLDSSIFPGTTPSPEDDLEVLAVLNLSTLLLLSTSLSLVMYTSRSLSSTCPFSFLGKDGSYLLVLYPMSTDNYSIVLDLHLRPEGGRSSLVDPGCP